MLNSVREMWIGEILFKHFSHFNPKQGGCTNQSKEKTNWSSLLDKLQRYQIRTRCIFFFFKTCENDLGSNMRIRFLQWQKNARARRIFFFDFLDGLHLYEIYFLTFFEKKNYIIPYFGKLNLLCTIFWLVCMHQKVQ